MSGNLRRDLLATSRLLVALLMYPVAAAAAVLALMSLRSDSRAVLYAAWALSGLFVLLAGSRSVAAARRTGSHEEARFFKEQGRHLYLLAALTGALLILLLRRWW